MNLPDLQREAHAIAKEKGWWDEERTFGDCIALVHSELSEALEEYRKHGLEPSSENPEQLRGPTHDTAWVDELGTFQSSETYPLTL